MKNILVPTDFSANAETALNYALALADADNARIILLHVYQIPLLIPEDSGFKNEIDKRLKDLANKILKKGIKHSIVSKEGPVVATILEIAKQKKASIIVMGTKGASGLKKIVVGSNTARVIQDSACPVLAVPEGIIYRKPRRIAYATDYHKSDLSMIKKLLEISPLFRTKIHLIHISGVKEHEEDQKDILKNFCRGLKESIGYENISQQLIYGTHAESALDDFVKDTLPDILVMSTHYRTPADKLFGSSVTKQMAYHTLVPLLVYHHKKNPLIIL